MLCIVIMKLGGILFGANPVGPAAVFVPSIAYTIKETSQIASIPKVRFDN
jgi:hypothetical protein